MARPAGPHHPPHGRPAGWHALRTDRVGRRLRADLRAPPGSRFSRRSHLLHVRTHVERGGVRLPAVRPRLRHQQPAGLLEHVPRVHQRRAGRGDRHRQGQRQPARHLRREVHRHRRAEPGHEPSAHAAGPGDSQAPGREDHRRQPPARSGAGQLPQPAESPRRHRPGRRHGRPAPAHPRQRRPRSVPGHRVASRGVGRPRPRVHRGAHAGLRRMGEARARRRSRRGRAGHRPQLGADHPDGEDDRRLRRHHLLLGHGAHAAPQRRGDDPRDHQRRARPWRHRQARRRPVPRARSLQRAGRPHDGYLGTSPRALPRRAGGRVRLRPAPRARLRHRRQHSRPARRSRPRVHRPGRQLRARRARHRHHAGLDDATPLSPCRSPPSSTGRT